MTITTMSFVFGALLLLVGIVGGGFEIRELRMPRVPGLARLVSSVAGVIFIGFALWPPGRVPGNVRMSGKEWGKDRLGADYSCFALSNDSPQECEDACKNDPKCKAWTYIKPNTTKGPRPQCCLKGTVPGAVDDPACVSGTKEN
jgi:PAN domain-containing protein